jgi:hypothetical protein
MIDPMEKASTNPKMEVLTGANGSEINKRAMVLKFGQMDQAMKVIIMKASKVALDLTNGPIILHIEATGAIT